MEGEERLEDEMGYDPECARVEAWLDEHPDFAYDYFIRYVCLDNHGGFHIFFVIIRRK